MQVRNEQLRDWPGCSLCQWHRDVHQFWTAGSEWQIGSAMASTGQNSGYGDPALDHSPSIDNKLAGVVIGGNANIAATQSMHYLTSPVINASGAGNIVLDFWRWLNTDYFPWTSNSIEVFNGVSLVVIWQNPSVSGDFNIEDNAWNNFAHDLTTAKNANMRVRFGFLIEQVDFSSRHMSSWNIDDVVIRRCQQRKFRGIRYASDLVLPLNPLFTICASHETISRASHWRSRLSLLSVRGDSPCVNQSARQCSLLFPFF